MNGINVIGFVSANFGLSVAARATVRLLVESGHSVAIADIQAGGDRSRQDHTFDHLMIRPEPEARLPYPITLFHLNPPYIGQLLRKRPSWLNSAGGYNVAVPFWELPVLPDAWIGDLGAMDAVLAPSHFIEQAVANALPGPSPLVRHYPQIAFLPEERRPDRIRFGLPEKGVLFVMSFELASDVVRKNPWAVMEAFNCAFTHNDNAYLIVKLNNSHISKAFEKPLAILRSYTAVNDHIIIRDERLSYGEAISLYESCDVFVSLHRGEGLGLGPMEAMLLGKPVIATAWSGNMDFMDDGNSCLVGCRLVPVESRIYRELIGGKPAVWADPSIAEAAFWMRRLHERPDLREEIGKRARADMLDRLRARAGLGAFETVRQLCEEKIGGIFAAHAPKPPFQQTEASVGRP